MGKGNWRLVIVTGRFFKLKDRGKMMTSLYALRRRYSQWTITQRQSLFVAEYRRGNAIRYLVAFSLDALDDALRRAGKNPLIRAGS